MTNSAYPLAWPLHFPRARLREAGRFSTTLSTALTNVQDSLERFSRDSGHDIEDMVITSNVTKADRRPADPGIAIWFRWKGMQVSIPCDRYHTVEANLQAIYHVLEAKRIELRHGSLEIVEASFRGFLLPGPESTNWREVLGVGKLAEFQEVKAAYRKLAGLNHPDKGGSVSDMTAINAAWSDALFEFAERG